MGTCKIIQTGEHIFEIYDYEYILSSKSTGGGRYAKDEEKEGLAERQEEYKKTSNNRARQKIRRLISSNFTDNDLFVTLTYKENMTDVDRASKDFKQFIQRMRRRYENFKYIAVIEFQKRGAVHYHMICDIPITWNNVEERKHEEREMGKIWRQGYVDIIDIHGIDNVGAYLVKYMSKECSNLTDDRLKGKKKYLHSKNLSKPTILEGEDLKATKEFLLENVDPVYTSQYVGEFTGEVKYKEFNLKRVGARPKKTPRDTRNIRRVDKGMINQC